MYRMRLLRIGCSTVSRAYMCRCKQMQRLRSCCYIIVTLLLYSILVRQWEEHDEHADFSTKGHRHAILRMCTIYLTCWEDSKHGRYRGIHCINFWSKIPEEGHKGTNVGACRFSVLSWSWRQKLIEGMFDQAPVLSALRILNPFDLPVSLS